MIQRLTVTVFFAAATLFLGALPAAAQGRSAGHGPGGGGAGTAGMHEPMDMGGHGDFGNAPATARGPKTPGELLSQNTKLSANLTNLLPSGMTAQQACANF